MKARVDDVLVKEILQERSNAALKGTPYSELYVKIIRHPIVLHSKNFIISSDIFGWKNVLSDHFWLQRTI